jgi:RNase H-fold protein (predicted Holliday junction resolvase)
VTLPLRAAPFITETLHPFFTNYFSEGWLEETQKKHVDGRFSPSSKTFDIAVAYGHCFGALRFVPTEAMAQNKPTAIQTTEEFPLIEPQIGNAEQAMIPGAQPKILVVPAESENTYRLAEKSEESTHIAKIVHRDYKYRHILQNELLATQIVQHLLPDDQVSEMKMAKVEDVPEEALVIKRFDRGPNGERISFFEFNQLLGKAADDKYDGAYSEMADYIYEHAGAGGKNGVQCELSDARKLFRRILAVLLIGNGDAHFKNFALMKKEGRFTLTPSYDLVSNSMYGVSRHDRFNQPALMLGGKHIYAMNAFDAKRLIMMAYEFQLQPEELLEDIDHFEKQIASIEAVITPYDALIPTVTKHFRESIKARWNGSFKNVRNVLRKKKPTNVFAYKTSRADAEASWTAADAPLPLGPQRSVEPSTPLPRPAP